MQATIWLTVAPHRKEALGPASARVRLTLARYAMDGRLVAEVTLFETTINGWSNDLPLVFNLNDGSKRFGVPVLLRENLPQ